MVCLLQNVASKDFRCWKDFEILATVLVRVGGGNVIEGSISNGFWAWMTLGLKAGVITGTTGIGYRGGPWAATGGIIEFSEEEKTFSELLEVWKEAPVSINFEFFPKLVEQRVSKNHQMKREMNPGLHQFQKIL